MMEIDSLCSAAQALRNGDVDPVDLVDACLDRIRKHDSDTRAWVLVDEEAARRVANLMTAEAAAGEFRGPLHGIPVGIKDIVDVSGMPTEAVLIDGICEREGPLWAEENPPISPPKAVAWQGPVGQVLGSGLPFVKKDAAGLPAGYDSMVALPIYHHDQLAHVVAWYL